MIHQQSLIEKLTASLAPTEEILRRGYLHRLKEQYENFVKELTEDGMDAEKRFFFPKSTMSRKQYTMQRAKYAMMEGFTDGVSVTRSFRGPNIRILKTDNMVTLELKAVELAKTALESYINKMLGKITAETEKTEGLDVSKVSYIGNIDPWSWSHLIVETTDGKRQIWRTKMIINVSSLGHAFNQWPTRLVESVKLDQYDEEFHTDEE